MTRRFFLFLLMFALYLTACTQSPEPEPTPTSLPIASPTPPPLLGAGFRYSIYGPWYDPGPAYWLSVGQQMAAQFPGAVPSTIWIVSTFGGAGTVFSFPGTHEDFNIHFSSQDRNEEALTLFDQTGMQVWLQVEPGEVDVAELIHIMLNQYGHHPSVVGVGVDVEWFHSDGTPEGRAVTDAEARAWVEAARSHNPAYRLFLKHWEIEKMPPTYRDGLVFVDDSQGFDSLESMVTEFAAWGAAFAPSPVGFQYGYQADERWWKELDNPPVTMGQRILDATPNTEGLFWVDFTVLQQFPPIEE